MVSPISPLIANVFMEEFKVKAFSSAPQPQHLWLRYVDDTFHHSGGKTQFNNYNNTSTHRTNHIYNSLQRNQTKKEALPFLDTLVSPGLLQQAGNHCL